MDRPSRQKINKEILASNDALDHLNLIDIYMAFHTKTAEYTFFSSEYGTFSRTDYKLVQKTSLNKFKGMEIISRTFSEHNSIKQEINYKKKIG